MAPMGVASRLSPATLLVFVLFLSLCIGEIRSLLVYDRQTLLDLQFSFKDIAALKHDEQKSFPPFLSGIPAYLYRASAPPSQRKSYRHRGKRSGRLVKLKVWLRQPSTVSRTLHGLPQHVCVPWRFLEPIDPCLTSVISSGETIQTRHSTYPRIRTCAEWMAVT